MHLHRFAIGVRESRLSPVVVAGSGGFMVASALMRANFRLLVGGGPRTHGKRADLRVRVPCYVVGWSSMVGSRSTAAATRQLEQPAKRLGFADLRTCLRALFDAGWSVPRLAEELGTTQRLIS
jgi:hypothetical protein